MELAAGRRPFSELQRQPISERKSPARKKKRNAVGDAVRSSPGPLTRSAARAILGENTEVAKCASPQSTGDPEVVFTPNRSRHISKNIGLSISNDDFEEDVTPPPPKAAMLKVGRNNECDSEDSDDEDKTVTLGAFNKMISGAMTSDASDSDENGILTPVTKNSTQSMRRNTASPSLLKEMLQMSTDSDTSCSTTSFKMRQDCGREVFCMSANSIDSVEGRRNTASPATMRAMMLEMSCEQIGEGGVDDCDKDGSNVSENTVAVSEERHEARRATASPSMLQEMLNMDCDSLIGDTDSVSANETSLQKPKQLSNSSSSSNKSNAHSDSISRRRNTASPTLMSEMLATMESSPTSSVFSAESPACQADHAQSNSNDTLLNSERVGKCTNLKLVSAQVPSTRVTPLKSCLSARKCRLDASGKRMQSATQSARSKKSVAFRSPDAAEFDLNDPVKDGMTPMARSAAKLRFRMGEYDSDGVFSTAARDEETEEEDATTAMNSSILATWEEATDEESRCESGDSRGSRSSRNSRRCSSIGLFSSGRSRKAFHGEDNIAFTCGDSHAECNDTDEDHTVELGTLQDLISSQGSGDCIASNAGKCDHKDNISTVVKSGSIDEDDNTVALGTLRDLVDGVGGVTRKQRGLPPPSPHTAEQMVARGHGVVMRRRKHDSAIFTEEQREKTLDNTEELGELVELADFERGPPSSAGKSSIAETDDETQELGTLADLWGAGGDLLQDSNSPVAHQRSPTNCSNSVGKVSVMDMSVDEGLSEENINSSSTIAAIAPSSDSATTKQVTFTAKDDNISSCILGGSKPNASITCSNRENMPKSALDHPNIDIQESVSCLEKDKMNGYVAKIRVKHSGSKIRNSIDNKIQQEDSCDSEEDAQSTQHQLALSKEFSPSPMSDFDHTSSVQKGQNFEEEGNSDGTRHYSASSKQLSPLSSRAVDNFSCLNVSTKIATNVCSVAKKMPFILHGEKKSYNGIAKTSGAKMFADVDSTNELTTESDENKSFSEELDSVVEEMPSSNNDIVDEAMQQSAVSIRARIAKLKCGATSDTSPTERISLVKKSNIRILNSDKESSILNMSVENTSVASAVLSQSSSTVFDDEGQEQSFSLSLQSSPPSINREVIAPSPSAVTKFLGLTRNYYTSTSSQLPPIISVPSSDLLPNSFYVIPSAIISACALRPKAMTLQWACGSVRDITEHSIAAVSVLTEELSRNKASVEPIFSRNIAQGREWKISLHEITQKFYHEARAQALGEWQQWRVKVLNGVKGALQANSKNLHECRKELKCRLAAIREAANLVRKHTSRTARKKRVVSVQRSLQERRQKLKDIRCMVADLKKKDAETAHRLIIEQKKVDSRQTINNTQANSDTFPIISVGTLERLASHNVSCLQVAHGLHEWRLCGLSGCALRFRCNHIDSSYSELEVELSSKTSDSSENVVLRASFHHYVCGDAKTKNHGVVEQLCSSIVEYMLGSDCDELRAELDAITENAIGRSPVKALPTLLQNIDLYVGRINDLCHDVMRASHIVPIRCGTISQSGELNIIVDRFDFDRQLHVEARCTLRLTCYPFHADSINVSLRTIVGMYTPFVVANLLRGIVLTPETSRDAGGPPGDKLVEEIRQVLSHCTPGYMHLCSICSALQK